MSFAIVLLTEKIFGGAEKRYTQLFFYLNDKEKGSIYYFVTPSLKKTICEIFPNTNTDNIIVINCQGISQRKTNLAHNKNKKTVSNYSLLKKVFIYHIYYFFKTLKAQYKIYKQIDHYKRLLHIKGFIGVFNGILPLYFYFRNKTGKKPGIIFSNMDSWFSNIEEKGNTKWFKKYATFNYALDKSDLLDFLSPFIYNGVNKLGLKLQSEKVSITPCSFTDYSKCHIGAKEKLRIVFSGRLEKDKNPVMFLEAALLLAKQFPEVEFHIMGEGRLSSVIKEKTDIYGLPNIVFHGFHRNPPEILAETSVFVSIQTTNNYPSQSVLEAMACGNAVVASDVGDTRMFVNDNLGSLIELNLESLVQCLKKYIEKPVIALEKGLKGSEYVRENHTIKRSAEYYMDLFRKAEKLVTIN